MNLHDYFNSPDCMSASALAESIGIKNVAQIRQWQHGYANRLPSPENCLAIERATGGKVTRQELQPEDFIRIWPDLAHLASATTTPPVPTSWHQAQTDETQSDAAQPVLVLNRKPNGQGA